MCYFLCMGVSQEVKNPGPFFPKEVEVLPIPEAPIRKAVWDDAEEGMAYVLTINGCSCDLMLGGHRMPGQPELVIEGIKKLLDQTPSITLMSHWYTQPLNEVPVSAAGQKKLKVKQFEKTFPRLDEDVRYIIAL